MPIDLSKVSTAQYINFFKDVLDGTPLFNLTKIVAVIFGFLFGLCYISFYIGGYLPGIESKDIKQKLEACDDKSRNTTQNQLSPQASIPNKAENCQADFISKQKADELQEKIKSLQFELNKKPTYVTCIGYGNEVDKLNKNKIEIENRILSLLNPQLSRQQIEQGFTGFTAEQLNTYARLAAEYRKTADDTQRQILSIHELRKNCE